MAVVKIRAEIKNLSHCETSSFEGNAILRKNVLTYLSEEIYHEVILNRHQVVLKRKFPNQDKFVFVFEEGKDTSMTYQSRMGKLEIPISTKSLSWDYPQLKIDYTVDHDENFSWLVEFKR